ncbi:magnesium transporter [Fimicolochytrium jonesii]|uniref:magnesium transporter n=1 Tax=Fimicolochytrium jonesii TaxID=1396493 RepID=UPI0022FE28AD|nr:magnesium transporter [Fimicolochytrium jonesii]KAI8819830.1 magnesium transporter [Fimicolochytrium jonesii]
MVLENKYVGLILALSSSFLIGTSFIITKLGLLDAARTHGGSAGEGYSYLQNHKWWAGMITMVLGEIANFLAYAYAPAILVTPLGAGSVVISAILASFFLNEELGMEGKIGAALCIIGSVVIILHAPAEPDVVTTDQILEYALRPGFVIYMLLVAATSLTLIYKIAPIYGKRSMIVYIAICSLVGSVSVMAVKGFGTAVRVTFAGQNQFIYPSTYVFLLTVVGCAMVQMNYFNKALDLFSTNRVTPIYYVFFSTATIIASILLFQGFEDASGRDVVSMFCGFLTIFVGVFQLNSHKPSSGHSGGAHPSAMDKFTDASRRNSLSAAGLATALVNEAHLLKTFDEESAPLRDLDHGDDSD